MSDRFAFAITVCSLLAAAVVLLGRNRGLRLALLVSLELALVGQAVADVVGLARGHRPNEPGVHLAYLVTSLVVLPAVVGLGRGESERWSGVLSAVGLVVTAVVVVRMQTTWRG